jgi:N-acetylneuraminic acid mutarotase
MSLDQDTLTTLERPTTSGWRTAAKTSPEAATRSHAAIIELDGTYWMFGNAPQDMSDLSSPDCVSWTSTYTQSPRRPLNAGTVYGGILMLSGGLCYTPPPPQATSEVYYRDPKAGAPWRSNETAPWGGRREHMMTTFDGKVWVIGGANQYYQYQNDAWFVATDLPGWQNDATWVGPARGWAATAVYNNQLWVIGGRTDADPHGTGLLATAAVKTAGQPWAVQTIAGDFTPRYGAQAQTVGDKLYVFGGHGPNGGLNDMWRYDGATWTQLSDTCPWSVDLDGFSSIVKNGEIYVLAGYDATAGRGNDVIYIYSPG